MDSLSPLTPADDIGIAFVSSSLYGAFFVLFVISSFILHRQTTWTKGTSTSGNFGTLVYLGLGYAVCCTVTLAWILSWVIILNPNLSHVNQPQTEWSVPLFVQNIFGWVSIYIAELILIFRLYIIWQKRKAILWGALVVTLGYIAVISLESMLYGTSSHIVSVSGVAASVIVSLCLNIIVTTLIIWKLWERTRLSRAIGGGRVVTRVAAILAESAAMYIAWMMVFLVLFWMGLPQSHVFLYGSPAVAGIAAMLVNIRVGLGWAAGEEGRVTRSLHNSAFANDPDDFSYSDEAGEAERTSHSLDE